MNLQKRYDIRMVERAIATELESNRDIQAKAA